MDHRLSNTQGIFLLAIILVATTSLHVATGAKTDNIVHIAATGPWTVPFGSFLTFAQFGAYLINNNDVLFPDVFPGILPNVTLVIDKYETGTTDPGTASVIAVNAGQGGIIAYLGGARTPQQQQVVYVADTLKIPYVGGIVSGATFSNKVTYPFFMRTSLSDQFMAIVMVKFIYNIGWENVALVYANDDFGIGNAAVFQAQAKLYNITTVPILITALGTDFTAGANQLAATKNRVIVLMTQYAEGLVFLKNASAAGLIGKDYVWLISQVFLQTFESTAQPTAIRALVQGAVAFKPSVEGGAYSSVVNNYWQQANQTLWPGTRTSIDITSWFLLEGIATLALGLDNYLNRGGANISKIDGKLYYNIMRNLSYDGVSGAVKFDSNGDRIGQYSVLNYNNSGQTLYQVKLYSPFTDSFTDFAPITYYDNTTIRPRDLPCRCQHGYCIGYSQTCVCDAGWLLDDCSLKDNFEKHSDVLSGTLGAILAASVIIALCALFLLAFRLSVFAGKSPMFCTAIILGTIIAYAAGFTLLPEPTDNLCMAFPWLLGVGFTLVYTCLFLKTWRVYRVIDSSMKCERVIITNGYIAKLIGIALSVEIIFLIIWTLVSPQEAQIRSFQDNSTRYQCRGDNEVAFWAVFVGYKTIWMIFGAVMAVKTRNFYDQYNDSKAIALSIYNTIILLIIGVPLAIVLLDFPYVLAVVEIAMIVVIFNFTLISIFFTAWMEIFFGDQQLPELPSGSSGTKSSRSNKSSSDSHPNSKQEKEKNPTTTSSSNSAEPQ